MATRAKKPAPAPLVALTRRSGATAATTHLTDAEADANDRAIDTLVQALGGRGGLLDTLAVASDAPEVEQILSLLIDPRYDKISLRRLCQMAGLTVVDLFAAVKKAMVTRAHLVAYKAIMEAIPPVVEDVMRRAAPYEILCGECGGSTTVEDPDQKGVLIPCTVCASRGKLLQHPDLDRQKLALELAQLVQKSAGISLQQNNLTMAAGSSDGPKAGGTLVELQHAVRELLSGARTPLEESEAMEPAPMTTADRVIDGTLAEEEESQSTLAETAREPVWVPAPDPIPRLGALG